MEFQVNISAWKLFQNLLHSKFQKMAEKIILWFLELYIFLRSIMAAQKYQNILQDCKSVLKDFWSSAKPKLKKLSLSKLSLL